MFKRYAAWKNKVNQRQYRRISEIIIWFVEKEEERRETLIGIVPRRSNSLPQKRRKL